MKHRLNGIKRRIYDKIVVDGKSILAIFDPGSQQTYITEDAIRRLGLEAQKLKRPFTVGLGGKSRLIKKYVVFDGVLQRHYLRLTPYLVDEIAYTQDGKDVDMLFGLLDMEEWYVELDIKNKRVDMSLFPKEFVEL